MGRAGKRIRAACDIRTLGELRDVRRELELRSIYAGERLVDNAEAVFSVENLLSLVAPKGSVIDRAVGGVGTGIAAVRGIFGALQMIRGRLSGRGGGCGC